MQTITAAVLHDSQGEFSLEQVELDEPRANEILVRIEASGVCHTDAWAKEQIPVPSVLGHEGVGIVEKTGAGVTRVKPGDRVIISYPWCGECLTCRDNRPYACEQFIPICFGGTRMDGSSTIYRDGTPLTGAFFQQSSFASHAITLESSVVPVGGDAIPELVAALPCGVQTGAGSVFNTFQVKTGQGLLVVGAGAVGLSAIMAAAVAGAHPVIAVDIVDERLALARELGATHTLNRTAVDIADALAEISPGGVQYSFETSGTVQGFEDAVNALGMEGVCGIVTVPLRGEKFLYTPEDLFMRIGALKCIVQGSSVPNEFLPKLMRLHDDGRFPYDRLIRTYPFSDINRAFDDARSGLTVKPVLVMGD